MNIILNNRPENINKDQISLADLIKYKNFTFRLIVTKVNGKLVKKDQRDKILISEGDDVMVLHLVSGG